MDEATSKGDQARTEILNAARDLFIKNGYNGTSMRAIAQAAGGRAVGGLYNHFKTKEEIFSAIIEEQNPYDDLMAAITGTGEIDTAPDFIRAMLGRTLRVMPRHYDFFQITQIDLREFQGAHLQRVLETKLLPNVLRVISEISALPGLKPVDPLGLMRVVASVVLGYMATRTLLPTGIFDDRSEDAWIDLYTDMVLHGLADDTRAEKG
ncbi:TetR/AcrR family transcriptional regulator [Aggregatilinea lenta]|uniref:TetR/AcrR family transcriptional regulator n=1 Tax=Aggregatilinea lenta TaxID=913108 RepID=UPI000E5A9D4E|nr:TetR/AcrR family transcriptional regulator [Aggregatilinea lenta]